MSESKSAKFWSRTFWGSLCGTILFRLWFSGTLPLSGDESYHWEWSRHLAFGYYDHPGLTAYLIRLSTVLFGASTETSLRFPALVMLSMTAVVAFLFARRVMKEYGGTPLEIERAGSLAGLFILFIPAFAAMSVYISTDPPLIFFWTLSLYTLYMAFRTGSIGWWIFAGLSVGCAMLSKFLAFFLVPPAGLFVLLSSNNRKWLKRPHPYVAGFVALLTFSPFLYWNATHEWATFMFNFVYRQNPSFAPQHVPEYLGVQAAVISPGLFLFAIWAMGRGLRQWRRKGDDDALFLSLFSLAPLLYFLYVSLRQQVGLHWPIAGWVAILVYLAVYWGSARHWDTAPGARPHRFRTISFVLCITITVLIHVAVHIPADVANRLNWKYKANPNRLNTEKHTERYGWHELGKWVQDVRMEMAELQKVPGQEVGREGVFVLSDQYGLASNIAFYTPGQIQTHLWQRRRTCGENYRFWDHFADYKGMDAILVSKKKSRLESALRKLKTHFERVTAPEELPITVDGLHVRSFYLVRCFRFNGKPPVFP